MELTEGEVEDLLNDPLCFLGASSTPDMYGPVEHCCRVYELDDRVGKFMDFCLAYDPNTEDYKSDTFELVDIWDRHTWNDEISSVWCGAKAQGNFCVDNVDCTKPFVVPGDTKENDLKDNSLDNKFGFVKITPFKGPPTVATLWSKAGCAGANHLI